MTPDQIVAGAVSVIGIICVWMWGYRAGYLKADLKGACEIHGKHEGKDCGLCALGRLITHFTKDKQ